MKTLNKFSKKMKSIPATTVWYLTDIAESRGRQDLFTKQAPQRLKALREHALIESAISSNRIEGVEVEQARIKKVVLGKAHLRDRDEEEIRGYRNALKLIHEKGADIPVSEDTVKNLHNLSRGDIWDSGKYKNKDGDIIEKLPGGRIKVRFKTVKASKTEGYMKELISLWDQSIHEQWVHPLISLTAFNLDFLCIHPFRDGNGRVSRLLLLLQCYHAGLEVGRYVSLERLIEQNKERYYETLEQSSQNWHKAKHDPWPYINYILYILKSAYKEFEECIGQIKSPRGSKTDLIKNFIQKTNTPFHVFDIQRECPGISIDMIRRVLKNLRATGQVKCLGRGQKAAWQKIRDK